MDEAEEGARGQPDEKSFSAMEGTLALFLVQQEATEGFLGLLGGEWIGHSKNDNREKNREAIGGIRGERGMQSIP